MNQKQNENELELINRYSRKELGADEVYVFSVTLCDNEIDRDLERFSKSALHALAPLYEGKTGIFDHNAKSGNQSARIFKTWVEGDSSKKTSTGEPYYMLKARAYMVRTESNKSLIEEIEGGIKKEVSVGCAMSSITCSICGADRKSFGCDHIPGKTYSGKLCHSVLSDPTDAYEWSFVAVPSQKAAGVTKSFFKEEKNTENTVEIIKAATGEVKLSKKEVEELKAYIACLEASSEDAKQYRNHLISGIEKYTLIAMPKVNCKSFIEGCKAMDVSELQLLKNSLKEQAMQALPPQIQLKAAEQSKATDNKAFQI